MKLKKNHGFTLIELIVVIAILGIMATTAIAVLNPFAQFQKANDAKRKADLSQIQKALEAYYQDAQQYPLSTGPTGNSATSYLIETNVKTSSCPTTPCIVNWGGTWQPYLDVVPSDPTPSKRYVYYVTNNGQTYYLYASLDRTSDPQLCQAGGVSCPRVPAGATCGGTCNFGLTSPDTTP